MIIGNGLIARAFMNNEFTDDNKYIIFASGVSNSNETDDSEFKREKELLVSILSNNQDKKIIYFTSILSKSKCNKYYNHKMDMERMIIESNNDYIIYRIPQMIGCIGNKFNLINNIKNNILNQIEIKVYNEILRSIFDVDDLVDFVNYSKDKINKEYINVSYIEKLSVMQLVFIVSSILGMPATYKCVKGHAENWYIQNSPITVEWMLYNNIKMKGYTEKVLKKYL